MPTPGYKLLGIEIGGSKLQMAIASPQGALEEVLRFAINPAGGAAAIRKQISNAWPALSAKGLIAGIGVGFGGPVNRQTGVVQVSHQVDGWAAFALGSWLQDMSDAPVAVDNDANVAALAEAKLGSGKGYNHVFYLTAGSGIGGGFVCNGTIYHGRLPGEMEVGHLRLSRSGLTLEQACSGWAVDKLVQQQIRNTPAGMLAQLAQTHQGPAAALLAPALAAGDSGALQLVNEIADNLALGLSHVVHLLNPDLLVMGGGLSLLGEYLLAPVRAYLPRYLLPALQPPPPLVTAALGEQVVPIGALELARQTVVHPQLTVNRQI